MSKISKGQVVGISQGESVFQGEFVEKLFEIST